MAVLFPQVGERENVEHDSKENPNRCPCLEGESSYRCKATWGSIRPNPVEISLYCFRTAYRACPVFSRFNKTGRRLTRWEYVVESMKRGKSSDASLLTFDP